MDIVPRPRNKKPVGCRRVYTLKYRVDGALQRYKVRLVGKGISRYMELIISKPLYR